MSKIYKYLLITILLPIAACSDFLDVVPSNIAVIEEAFETRDNAERFLATLYGYLPPFSSISNPALSATDEIRVNDNVSRNWAGHIMATGGQSRVNPSLGYWGNNSVENLFVALRDCNIFLENVDKPFDLDETEKLRWIAEAKVLKAYFHFYLARMYGPIPLVKENIEVSAGLEQVRVRRSPVDEAFNYSVELLDEAINSGNLPVIIEDVGAELGRFTQAIALALKAKVLVTAASPLFNGNTDYSGLVDADGTPLISQTADNGKWQKAAVACQEAIDFALANNHDLYEYDGNVFVNASDTTLTKLAVRGAMTEPWNREIIWGSSQSSVSGGFQSWAQAKINPNLTAENRESTQSWWSPPLHIAEMFYSKNGVPIEEDSNYDYVGRYGVAEGDEAHKLLIKEGEMTAKLNFDRELRFYAFLGFDNGIWEGHGQTEEGSYHLNAKRGEVGGRLDANRWSLSGYWAKKMVYYENVQRAPGSGYSSERYPFPVIRLADLYLMHAEALNEIDNIPEAQIWIDKVRARAGLNGVVESWQHHSSNPSKPTTKDGLRAIIQQERMIELAFEGQRLWDLRRWKRAEEFQNVSIRGWNIEGEDTESYYNVITYGRFQFALRDYLWPIAEQDILTNPNLIQNPGW